MSWYEEMLGWLDEQAEHDRDLQAAYDAGWRAGWMTLALQWPWLKEPDCVEKAYREGVHDGLQTARINVDGQRRRRVA